MFLFYWYNNVPAERGHYIDWCSERVDFTGNGNMRTHDRDKELGN